MGSCCGCHKKNIEEDHSSESVLIHAKHMRKTKNNRSICRSVRHKLITKSRQITLSKKNPKLRPILTDPYSGYCDVSEIINNLYLTGIGGINLENISDKNINCIINATYETIVYDVEGIEYLRIPVEDKENENISIYFDEVSDQIDQWISQELRVVVHCVCGVSRSSTLVIAYLMKYKEMNLRTAFIHLKSRRHLIRPNTAFSKQLMDYEKSIYQTNSVHFVDFVNNRGKTIKTLDVLVQQFRKDVENEDKFEDSIQAFLNAFSKTSVSNMF